jgi:hypothetical protein
VLCPGDGNVHSPLIDQKAKTSLHGGRRVSSDAANDDDVLFLPLESINGVHLNVPVVHSLETS